MNCARWPWITWYCTAPTRKISRPMAVDTGAMLFGSTTPEAMKGAAIAKASRRSDSARSGRRRSISRPENSDSSERDRQRQREQPELRLRRHEHLVKPGAEEFLDTHPRKGERASR